MIIGINTNRFYPHRHWFFYFKKYTYVRGVMFRIFGLYVNAREDRATDKLIEIWNKRYNRKRGGEA